MPDNSNEDDNAFFWATYTDQLPLDICYVDSFGGLKMRTNNCTYMINSSGWFVKSNDTLFTLVQRADAIDTRHILLCIALDKYVDL